MTNARRATGSLACLVLLVAMWPATSLADLERQFPYSGALEKDGVAVSGTVSLRFFLLAAESDLVGAALWTELHDSVEVHSGRFSAMLGSKTPIPAGVLSRDTLFLAIEINGSEMSGRKRIAPVPFAVESYGAPPGSVMAFAGNTPPSGWLLCAGQTLNIADYPRLASVISNTYGGNGSTTFAVPNLRGRMPLGKDNMTGTSANVVANAAADSLGGTGGEENSSAVLRHSHPIPNQAAHQHSIKTKTNAGVGNSSDGMARASSGSVDTNTFKVLSAGGHNHGGNTTATGNTTVTNMPPFMTLNYIIKF